MQISSHDLSGQGLLVLAANQESTLSNVHFVGLDSIKDKGMGITGSVTFYESPVLIERCIFSVRDRCSSIEVSLMQLHDKFMIWKIVNRHGVSTNC